jgi:hypothetical protein
VTLYRTFRLHPLCCAIVVHHRAPVLLIDRPAPATLALCRMRFAGLFVGATMVATLLARRATGSQAPSRATSRRATADLQGQLGELGERPRLLGAAVGAQSVYPGGGSKAGPWPAGGLEGGRHGARGVQGAITAYRPV